MDALTELLPELSQQPPEVRQQTEIALVYEGYLAKEEAQIRKARQMEQALLPEDTPYQEITGLGAWRPGRSWPPNGLAPWPPPAAFPAFPPRMWPCSWSTWTSSAAPPARD